MELAIVKYIKEHGLAKAINDFKLKTNVCENKILLKYDMLESPMAFQETRECRGLILERDTWKVMSLAFIKFFNYGEGHAANIDLNTAKCLIKKDGTLIQLYWDWYLNVWCSGTSGTPNGEGNVNSDSMTFSELFWYTAKFDINRLDKDLIYVFELCTPKNIIVTPHVTYSITLLTIRNRITLSEIPYEELSQYSLILGIELIGYVSMNVSTLDEIKNKFEGMPFSEEGYVIVDGNFNRVKIKNPAYVAAHFLRSKTATHHILDIIKSNEIEEFIATFPDKKDDIINLKCKYDILTDKLQYTWFEIFNRIIEEYPVNDKSINRKIIADIIINTSNISDLSIFTGLFFSLYDNKIKSVKEYLMVFDNKKLYKILN
jgi:hypothetical protein